MRKEFKISTDSASIRLYAIYSHHTADNCLIEMQSDEETSVRLLSSQFQLPNPEINMVSGKYECTLLLRGLCSRKKPPARLFISISGMLQYDDCENFLSKLRGYIPALRKGGLRTDVYMKELLMALREYAEFEGITPPITYHVPQVRQHISSGLTSDLSHLSCNEIDYDEVVPIFPCTSDSLPNLSSAQ